jgi:hypothetical protein
MDLTANSSTTVTIYRKTAKGHTEIETRANRLPPRLRGVLIIVDGRTADRDLRKLAGENFDALLKELLTGGYVEPVATLDARAVPAARPATPASQPGSGFVPSRPPSTLAPVQPAVPEASQGLSPSPAEITTLRRAAVRHLTDQVGPMAENLAIKIESARNWAELRPLLVIGMQIITNVRGRSAGEVWRERFIGP